MFWDDEPISYRDEYIDPFSDLEEDLSVGNYYDEDAAAMGGWDEEDIDGHDDEG